MLRMEGSQHLWVYSLTTGRMENGYSDPSEQGDAPLRICGTGSVLKDSASVKGKCEQMSMDVMEKHQTLASLISIRDGPFVSRLEPEKYPLKN